MALDVSFVSPLYHSSLVGVPPESLGVHIKDRESPSFSADPSGHPVTLGGCGGSEMRRGLKYLFIFTLYLFLFIYGTAVILFSS